MKLHAKRAQKWHALPQINLNIPRNHLWKIILNNVCVILTSHYTIRKTTMNTAAQLSVKIHGIIPDFTFPHSRIQTLKGHKAELALTTTMAVNSLSLKLKISSTNEHPKQPAMSKFLPSVYQTKFFSQLSFLNKIHLRQSLRMRIT